MKILNAFSLNMVSDLLEGFSVRFTPLSQEAVGRLSEQIGKPFYSAIGHADTAALVSADLGMKLPYNRETISVERGDEVLVAQYRGPRLEEGTTVLPEGARFEYVLVSMPKRFNGDNPEGYVSPRQYWEDFV